MAVLMSLLESIKGVIQMSNCLAGNENCDCATRAGFAKAGKRGYDLANQSHRFCNGAIGETRCVVCGKTKRARIHNQSIKPTVTTNRGRQAAAVREAMRHRTDHLIESNQYR
jgi:hypothetical protein